MILTVCKAVWLMLRTPLCSLHPTDFIMPAVSAQPPTYQAANVIFSALSSSVSLWPAGTPLCGSWCDQSQTYGRRAHTPA